MRDMQDAPGAVGADTEQATELEHDVEQTRDQAGRLAADAKEIAAQTAAQAREKATEVVEEARERSAERVLTAAGTVREKVAGAGGVPETAGIRIADGMEKTATYMRQNDTGTILHDAVQYVREHPKRSIVAAVVVGFILGRIFR